MLSPCESFPRDADDRELVPVDTYKPAEDARVGPELLPERIADDGDVDPSARALLFGGKGASMCWRRAEDLEVVSR